MEREREKWGRMSEGRVIERVSGRLVLMGMAMDQQLCYLQWGGGGEVKD